MAFWLQPFSINSTASQSSNFGWLGRSPWTPKSSLVSTIPWLKYCSQIRFTATRAVSGLSLLASHRASPSRFFGNPSRHGLSAAGVPADTVSPGLRKLPRTRSLADKGSVVARSPITSVLTMPSESRSFCNCFSSSRFALSDGATSRKRLLERQHQLTPLPLLFSRRINSPKRSVRLVLLRFHVTVVSLGLRECDRMRSSRRRNRLHAHIGQGKVAVHIA